MIISTIRINAAPARKKEILEILYSVKGPTEGQPGCLSSNIYQNLLANNIIIYVEVWKNKTSLFKHIRSPLYRSVLAAIDMSCELPDIKFSAVSNVDGIELIKAALSPVGSENVNNGALTQNFLRR
jgi:quinol monooxygenase YgiN